MKLPLRIKETLYHDDQTGKPVGSEYWIFDDAAEELFVINDDEDAARRIVACVNACAGMDTEQLEFFGEGYVATLTNLAEKRHEENNYLQAIIKGWERVGEIAKRLKDSQEVK